MRQILVLLLIPFLVGACDSNENAAPEPEGENPMLTGQFEASVLIEGDLDEPMVFEVLENGVVLIAERKGGLKKYDPATDTVTEIGFLEVNTKYTSAEGNVTEAEEGLFGMTVHPDFEQNNWIYLLYADPEAPRHVLSRWSLMNDQLVAGSEVEVLVYPAQRETCCHTGGGMAWDLDGNLYITTGNNTGNSITSQTDERPGRSSWDDQRGAANTNDLRGKILRIHPEEDGTYSIPAGNLFATGTPDTKPEIFAMGLRNPWRVSIDNQTGFVYWGEVGPDGFQESATSQIGYDELNQAKEAGNFGWPYFVGDNAAFPFYDFAMDAPLTPKDPDTLLNTSVNNTGQTALPPAQPAFIYYPYMPSAAFPEVGEGGRSATGGPIFRKDDFDASAAVFPDEYEGNWFAADFMRNWIMAITIDDAGAFVSMERFMPGYAFSSIIDLKFGPDGSLYVLQYGQNWFANSPNDKLIKISYSL